MTPWTGPDGNIRGPQGAQGIQGPAGPSGNDPRIYLATKPSSQSTSGTTAVDIAGMSFPVGANETWRFEMDVDVGTVSGTSPTLNFGFTTPASGVSFRAKRRQMTSASVEATSVITTAATLFGAGAVVANTRHTFEGTIVNGGTAGTVQLRVTPGGTTPVVQLLQGSAVRAFRLA